MTARSEIALFENGAMQAIAQEDFPLDCTTSALAYAIGLSTPQTRTMLKRLERGGKVERVWPTTSREYQWRLTGVGRTALATLETSESTP